MTATQLPVLRLHLASLVIGGSEWPVHGFVVPHPTAGAILIDSGVGGPEKLLTDWRVVNRSVADALAEHDLAVGDIQAVVNSHLHFDHCGQNAVFKHAPFFVQRAELERARRDQKALSDWFDFAGARFELLDGDAEIAEGVRALATPGHTVGHQSILVGQEGAPQVMIGDAAYTTELYADPDREAEALPRGQAADHGAWSRSLRLVHSLRPGAVHFCHDTRVLH
jgi:N-acyl homoserine lactone hydrolase